MQQAFVIILVVIFGGCASGAPTTREKTTVAGAALGAGTGALIGAAAGGNAGTGALIGAGLGVLSGALLGDQLQKLEGERGPAAPRPAGAEGAAPSTAVASRPAGDPTKGEFINATQWVVRVYVNPDPNNLEATTPIVLSPNATVPFNLDLGTYRIVAGAHVKTQFGERSVGRFDRTVQIDPRRTGWFIKFQESDFR